MKSLYESILDMTDDDVLDSKTKEIEGMQHMTNEIKEVFRQVYGEYIVPNVTCSVRLLNMDYWDYYGHYSVIYDFSEKYYHGEEKFGNYDEFIDNLAMRWPIFICALKQIKQAKPKYADTKSSTCRAYGEIVFRKYPYIIRKEHRGSRTIERQDFPNIKGFLGNHTTHTNTIEVNGLFVL